MIKFTLNLNDTLKNIINSTNLKFSTKGFRQIYCREPISSEAFSKGVPKTLRKEYYTYVSLLTRKKKNKTK